LIQSIDVFTELMINFLI